MEEFCCPTLRPDSRMQLLLTKPGSKYFFSAIRQSYWKPKQGLTYSSGSATATSTTSTPSIALSSAPHHMPQRGGIFHPSNSRYVSGTKITTLSAVYHMVQGQALPLTIISNLSSLHVTSPPTASKPKIQATVAIFQLMEETWDAGMKENRTTI